MRGKPKFNIGDTVNFTIDNITYTGDIYIIDAYGTWDDPSDVSYDIMVHNFRNTNNDCLFKHITERLVKDE